MNFWRNKRVAVTGGNGFLGQHVINALGFRDVAPDHIYVPEYDLREARNVGRLYFEFRPDIVIHLAASVGGLGANIEHPGSYFYDNVKMGIELMEAGRRYGIEKFVQMGSACEYPKDAPAPLSEKDVWNGYPEPTNAPYGIAKRTLLTMGQAYRRQYGMNVIHLLSTNLYGPGDNFDEKTSHVIPALIRRCIEAKENKVRYLPAWGSGSATRDFLYVDDAAEGILLATERYDESEPVNLGSGREVTIRNLASKIAVLTKCDGYFVWDVMMPEGQPRRILDTSRAKETFGFEASTPLESGLRRTVQWYNEKSRSGR